MGACAVPLNHSALVKVESEGWCQYKGLYLIWSHDMTCDWHVWVCCKGVLYDSHVTSAQCKKNSFEARPLAANHRDGERVQAG